MPTRNWGECLMTGETERPNVGAVDTNWEIVESGPAGAEQTVLLLPGGMCSARSYAEVMAEPALAGVRLIAVTMPGHAGAPAPQDFSVEEYARITAELAKQRGPMWSSDSAWARRWRTRWWCRVPSRVQSCCWESACRRRTSRRSFERSSGSVRFSGRCRQPILKKGAASMVKHAPLPPERRVQLQADFARNNTRDMRQGLREYLRWLHRDDDPARRLCEAGVPAWVVHAEKGDGGLTPHERAVLEACPACSSGDGPGTGLLSPQRGA